MNISTIECISESENMEWMIKQLSKSQRDRNLFAIFRLFGSCHLMIEIPLRLESQKITTFFEYEMNISYISIYSESKNMEDCRDRRFPLRDSRFLNDRIESCSKLSYANCSKVSCIYTTYLYITYSSLSDHVLPHQRPQVIREPQTGQRTLRRSLLPKTATLKRNHIYEQSKFHC